MSLDRSDSKDETQKIYAIWAKEKASYVTQCNAADSIESLNKIANAYAKWLELANMDLLPDNKAMESHLASLKQEIKNAFIRKINEIIQAHNNVIAAKYQEWSRTNSSFKDLSKLNKIEETLTQVTLSAETPPESFITALAGLEEATLAVYQNLDRVMTEHSKLANQIYTENTNLARIIETLDIQNIGFSAFSAIKEEPINFALRYRDEITEIRRNFARKLEREAKKINDSWQTQASKYFGQIKNLLDAAAERPGLTIIINTAKQLIELKTKITEGNDNYQKQIAAFEVYPAMVKNYEAACFPKDLQARSIGDFPRCETLTFAEPLAELDAAINKLKDKLQSIRAKKNKELSDFLAGCQNDLNSIWSNHAENPCTGDMTQALAELSRKILEETQFLPKATNVFNTDEELKYDQLVKSMHTLVDSVDIAVQDLSRIKAASLDLFKKKNNITPDLGKFTGKDIHINGYIDLKERIEQFQVSANTIQADLQKVAANLETQNNIKLPITNIGKRLNIDSIASLLKATLTNKEEMVIKNYNQGVKSIKHHWDDASFDFNDNLRLIKLNCNTRLNTNLYNSSTELLLTTMEHFIFLLSNHELSPYTQKINECTTAYQAILAHIPQPKLAPNEPIKFILDDKNSVDEYLSSIRTEAKNEIIEYFTSEILDKLSACITKLDNLPNELSIEAASDALHQMAAWEKEFSLSALLESKMDKVNSLLEDVNNPFNALKIKFTQLSTELDNKIKEKTIQAEAVLLNSINGALADYENLCVQLQNSMGDKVTHVQQQMISVDESLLKAAVELKTFVNDPNDKNRLSIDHINDEINQNKVDSDILINNLMHEKMRFFKKNETLFKIIQANPQFHDQWDKLQTIEGIFSKVYGQTLDNIDSILQKVTTKYELLTGAMDSLKNVHDAYIDTRDTVNDLAALEEKHLATPEDIKIEVNIAELENEYSQLESQDKKLGTEIAYAMQGHHTQNPIQLINDKLENNKKMAAVLVKLSEHTDNVANVIAADMFSLTEKQIQIKSLENNLNTTKQINQIVIVNDDIDIQFKTKLDGLSERLNEKLNLNEEFNNINTEIDQKIAANEQRMQFYTNIPMNQMLLQNADFYLVNLLHVEKINQELINLNNQANTCLNNFKQLYDTSPISSYEEAYAQLKNINAHFREKEALHDKKLELKEEIINRIEAIQSILADQKDAGELSRADQANLHSLEKQLTAFSSSLNESPNLLTLEGWKKGINDIKEDLDAYLYPQEIEHFVSKNYSEVNYSLFIRLQNYILNCNTMRQLLDHNHKAGSLKVDLVDRYEAGIKAASNLEQLIAAVKHNPKGPNPMDPNGEVLSLRSNTGNSATFFISSKSKDLMEELQNKLNDKIQFHLADLRQLKKNAP